MGLDLSGFGSAFDLIGKVVDKIWPDPGQAAQAKLKLMELQQNGELKELEAMVELAKSQNDVNKIEAANPSLFVSGWRPGAGWICVFGLGYSFLGLPLLTWASTAFGFPPPPPIDLGVLVTTLLGMLGLGGMRVAEKKAGVARE